MHFGVAVAVADEQAAVRGDGQIRGQVERHAGRTGDAGGAQGPLQFAVGGEFVDAMALPLGAVEVVFGIDPETVSVVQQILSPRGEKVSVPVENDHGVLASAVDVDPVPAVDGDGGNPAEGPTRRKPGPIAHRLVPVVALSHRHLALLPDWSGIGTPAPTPVNRRAFLITTYLNWKEKSLAFRIQKRS